MTASARRRRDRAPLPAVLTWPAAVTGRLYGGLARWRRHRATRPGQQRRLRHPVVSIGNLAVGGTGKTPLAAWIAGLLAAAGERPAILSRGYGRTRESDGVTVVRDRAGIRSTLAEAGDEPLMLAHAVEGSVVVVARDRHLAGVLAESRLGCTVHILDDGFQHLALARDVDLLLLRARDFDDATLPAGWLREPLLAAASADAWIVDEMEAASVAPRSGEGGPRVFALARRVERPRLRGQYQPDEPLDTSSGLLLVSGIAGPDRFEADMRALGYAIVDHVRYPDHHVYRRADLRRIADRMRRHQAAVVVTTAKDMVRLTPLAPLPFPVAVAEMAAAIDPAEPFRAWLIGRLDAARRTRRAAGWPP